MKLIKLTIILFILSTLTVLGQKSIKGKVIDSKGIPIPLVNVIIKGTAEGTVTNMDGLYKLDNVKPVNILVFSFIGYQNKEVKVLDSEVINVTLVDDATQLDEIVLIGYDAVKKKDLTGSVSKIKVEDIARTATVNFDQALAGRAAGVKVTSNDGTPGNALDIVIRGGNSITGSNSCPTRSRSSAHLPSACRCLSSWRSSCSFACVVHSLLVARPARPCAWLSSTQILASVVPSASSWTQPWP